MGEMADEAFDRDMDEIFDHDLHGCDDSCCLDGCPSWSTAFGGRKSFPRAAADEWIGADRVRVKIKELRPMHLAAILTWAARNLKNRRLIGGAKMIRLRAAANKLGVVKVDNRWHYAPGRCDARNDFVVVK